MPWRKPGDRQVSSPIPVPADGDAEQPPTLPDTDSSDLSQHPAPAGSLSAELDRVNRANTPTITTPSARSAKLSRRVLVLFSGPYARPDGLIAFLRRLDLQVSALDNDASNGGNAAHDILDNSVFWLMPDIVSLCKFASCRFVTFPMCAFGVNYEKPTTIMYSLHS